MTTGKFSKELLYYNFFIDFCFKQLVCNLTFTNWTFTCFRTMPDSPNSFKPSQFPHPARAISLPPPFQSTPHWSTATSETLRVRVPDQRTRISSLPAMRSLRDQDLNRVSTSNRLVLSVSPAVLSIKPF